MEITITQNEDQWQQARTNRFTASVVHKLMGSSRTGALLSKSAETFVYEKAAELLTGQVKPIYGDALEWGKQYEPDAFHVFDSQNFEQFTYYGGETYVFIPYGNYSGYSPDGLSENAILEIKCPYNSGIHLKNFSIYDADSLKSVHPEYYWQMQLGMIASNLENGYFVSMILVCLRINRYTLRKLNVMRYSMKLMKSLRQLGNYFKVFCIKRKIILQ